MLDDSWVNNLTTILSNDDRFIIFIDNLNNFSWFDWMDWFNNFWFDNFWFRSSSWCFNSIKEFLGLFSEEFALFGESCLKVCITLSESVLEWVFIFINLLHDHTQNLWRLFVSSFKEVINNIVVIISWLSISCIKVLFKFGDCIIEIELEVLDLRSKFSTLLVQKLQLFLCWFTAIVQSLSKGRHLVTETRDKINHLLSEFIDSLIELVIERVANYSEPLLECCLEVGISILSEHG